MIRLGVEVVKKSHYYWQKMQEQIPDDALKLGEKVGLSPLTTDILWQRGVHTEAEIQQFINPELAGLHDPFLMHDMEKAVERIQQAILDEEAILIYGDYDADGITSTSILKETLEMLGANVSSILPNRFLHGYGPNKELFAEKIAEGTQLIITVDNGVAGHEAIEAAQVAGVDVIVTDHHELPETLPKAFAIVHPRHPDGEYPFGELAGVGVAFKVATALLEEVPVEFLDLAAIGTVADLVPLQGENRILVKYGLQQIKSGDRPGISALLKISGVEPTQVTEMSIGFSLAPRLNAIGRLGDPNPGVELLTTFEETTAETLAKHCDDINEERKKIVEENTAEALALIERKDKIHVIAKAGWHEGVLGIVAGNILKETGHPAIVLTIKEDGSAKGSGRSIEALNLYEALVASKPLFTRFGGHHAAVGMTLPADNLPLLKEELHHYIEKNQIDVDRGQTLIIDHELHVNDVSLDFIQQLEILSPFGIGNPIPHFLFHDVMMEQVRQIGAEKQHLKYSLTSKGNQLPGVGFGFGKYFSDLSGTEVDCVGTLNINEWNGKRIPQLMLKDFAIQGLQVFDIRSKQTPVTALDQGQSLFVAFDKRTVKRYQESIKNVYFFKSFEEIHDLLITKPAEQIIFLDCPAEKETLKQIVLQNHLERIYIHAFCPDEAYLNGLGTRKQFGLLYRFLEKQQTLNVRRQLKRMAEYLRVSEKLLVYMLQVFFELKFVKIEDGQLEFIESPQKSSLEESKIYQNRKKQISSEEFFVFSDTETIRNWLAN